MFIGPMLIAYIVCGSRREADRIGIYLLRQKLVACTNRFPVESRYLWKGNMKTTREYVLLAKTAVKHQKTIIREVTRMHSYEIPCIAFVRAKANTSYETWVGSNLQ